MVAVTPELRAKGLQDRTYLDAGTGMMFAWPEPGTQTLWMKDMTIPLSAAFMDASGRILNIVDMEPNTEVYHYSDGVASFAVEVPLGWFAEVGLQVGDGCNPADAWPWGVK